MRRPKLPSIKSAPGLGTPIAFAGLLCATGRVGRAVRRPSPSRPPVTGHHQSIEFCGLFWSVRVGLSGSLCPESSMIIYLHR